MLIEGPDTAQRTKNRHGHLALQEQRDALCFSVCVCVCQSGVVCVLGIVVVLFELKESPEYAIRRVMVSSTVLLPFPSAAKSLPVDKIRSDKSRQLSLHFIHTDTPAPR